MSTRSGKRNQRSISENVESVSEIQIERKTRSKRDKKSSDEVATAKKKKNFVRHPSDDEIESSNDTTQNTSKSVRKSRRHTLKELNKLAVDYEASSDRKSMRQSRRIRKEDTVEPPNVHIQGNNEIGKEKKKNKKKKGAVIENLENEPVEPVQMTKKKNSKKKKKSNSFIVEELVTLEHNKSNLSIDSFHSAAGSPAKDNEPLKDDKNSKNRDRKANSSFTSYSSVVNVKDMKKKNKKIEDDNCLVSSINNSVKSKEFLETRCNKTEQHGDEYEKTKKNRCPGIDLSYNSESTNAIELNCIDTNFQSAGMKRKSIEKTNKIKKSAFHFDFTDTPHVNGTINGSEESISTSNSFDIKRKSVFKNSDKIDTCMTLINACTEEKLDSLISETKMQSDEITLNSITGSQKRRKSNNKDATCEKINLSHTNLNQTLDETTNSYNHNIHPDKEQFPDNRECSRSDSSIRNTTYDKIEESLVNLDTTFNKEPSKNCNPEVNASANKSRRSSRTSLPQGEGSTVLNGTYDKIVKDVNTSFCNNTYEKIKLDTTLEKTNGSVDGDNTINLNPKSSIMSLDNTENMTSDMSEDGSHTSITSDDSRTENIVNTTPLLIESSIDESQMNLTSISSNKTATPQKEKPIVITITPDKRGNVLDNDRTPAKREETFTDSKTIPLKRDGTYTDLRKTPSKQRAPLTEEPVPRRTENPTTPLQREGTFTKESPDATSMKPINVDKTPTRRQSVPSPGRTPFPSSRGGTKGRVSLNVTHSIEKPKRRSSAAAAPPRLTKVMFCSPVDNPLAATHVKGKVIKSNLKGSNKSFMFDESVSERSGESRKRSRTQGGAEDGAKRARLALRLRTTSAAARLQIPSEAEATPPGAKSDAKTRTKLPDFAALHQKQFSKMESLDECQRRRARRARELLTPTRGPLPHHKETSDAARSQATKKPESPKSKETDKKNQSYTRFGFKLNLDVNPFSVPAKNTDVNTKNIIKPRALKPQGSLPSLAGSTLRKDVAKQTVMREKSFADKRDVHRSQNRTVIKGVRTNRRFELQMKMRNID